jgi:hypothetical protein
MRKSIAALTVGAALSAIALVGSVADAAPAVTPTSAPATCAISGSGDVIVTTITLAVRMGPGTDYAAQPLAIHGGAVLFCRPAQAGGRYTACGHSDVNGWIEIYRKQGFGYVPSACVTDY